MEHIKKKYYIWALPYRDHSGGVLALHRLAHNLTLLGEEVYCVTDGLNPRYNTKSLDPSRYHEMQSSDAVVIYPEIVFGNPFNAKNIVRWILNTPGVMGGDGIYGERDLIFKFIDYFTVDSKYKVSGFLTAYDGKLDVWSDLDQPRNGTCFLVRKGKGRILDKHPEGSIQIDGWEAKGGDQFLLKVFNECQLLICYDPSSFTNVIAALCGCIPVVIPEDGMTREQWYEKIPFYKNGIAYGFGDILRAIETRPNLRAAVRELEENSLTETREMVKICESHFN